MCMYIYLYLISQHKINVIFYTVKKQRYLVLALIELTHKKQFNNCEC